MHRAPFEERMAFYRYASAHMLFGQAVDVLTDIRDHGDEHPDWLLNALWTAFFVTYYKPFRQQVTKEKGGIVKPGLRLEESIVPVKYAGLHLMAMRAREKQWAHTDHDKFLGSDGYPLTTIRANVDETRIVHIAIKGIHPNAKIRDAFFLLLEVLRKKTDYHQMKIWRKWIKHIDLEPSTVWDLNGMEADDDVFIALDPLTGKPSSSTNADT